MEKNDEFTTDHVFYSHLVKRNELIEELYEVSIDTRKAHLYEIAATDEYLEKYRARRNLHRIYLTQEMKDYNPFDIDSFIETILTPEELDDTLWEIADELRRKKDTGLFRTFREAYACGVKQLKTIGRLTTVEKLENAYHKAVCEGVIFMT